MSNQETYKKQVAPSRRRVEDLLGTFEAEKEVFAKAYQQRRFDDMNASTSKIQTILKSIEAIFLYKPPHKNKNLSGMVPLPDFRKDQQLKKLIGRLHSLLENIKEASLDLNLGKFVYQIDLAQKQVYRILQRCDDIEANGINTNVPKRQRVPTTAVLKDNFENWEGWVRKERAEKKNDHEPEEEDTFGEIMDIFDRVGVKTISDEEI